jgi:hypothetical protein
MILGSDEAILGRWAQCFEELLNGNALEHVEDMNMVQNQGNFEMEEPVPTINGIEQAIKKLRNNQSKHIIFSLTTDQPMTQLIEITYTGNGRDAHSTKGNCFGQSHYEKDSMLNQNSEYAVQP